MTGPIRAVAPAAAFLSFAFALLAHAAEADAATAASGVALDPCASTATSAGGTPAIAPTPAAGLRSAHVRLPDGTRLRVVESGPPDGEPVILLHGYTDSWYSFSRLLPLLPAGYRAIALDQRGHGCSDRPQDGYAMDALARDVLALMDARGIARATVVGHSMGGFVAQQVARAAPERVTRLVLVGSAPRLRGVAGVAEFAEAVEALSDPVPADFVRDFQASTVHGALPEAFIDGVVAESLRLPARVWQSLMRGMLAVDAAAVRAAAAVPTQILWGDRDSVFSRAEQDALLAAIPGATLTVYEGTGHAPHWERPERFAEDLARFLRAPAG
jgi:pimeloyl-ACP methyl ester carboxylesterase